MLAITQSLGLLGIEPFVVTAEVNIARAIPSFEIVGLPDTAVRESRERVRSAFANCKFPFPEGRITVNLAPAGVKKAGALYDLPILIGLLGAQGVLPESYEQTVFLGELSLSGELHPVNGVLPMLLGASEQGFTRAFIPWGNAAEASEVRGMEIFPIRHVQELTLFLQGQESLSPVSGMPFAPPQSVIQPDFCDVKGQQTAKRAMEVAAAGGHNLLMVGSPGTGKSMLAKRLASILPEMSRAESIETTKIYSSCGQLEGGVPLIRTRPFRAPHHSVSAAGLCGGGSVPRPGEISLAHNGVLFLDELPEFARHAMEALRQPLEDGRLTISRSNFRVSYPSRIMLVAAMNPCPCGYFGHPTKHCVCTEHKVSTYLGRISGPLLDRIDLHLEVMPVAYEQISAAGKEESSASIRARVEAARALQQKRFAQSDVTCNAQIPPALLRESCPLSSEAEKMLRLVFEKLGLSGRAYDRILKVARTIADLDGSELIEFSHISEAVQYRNLDRKYWERGR